MEERISDRICKDVFEEFYTRRNFEKSLKSGKRVFRLLTRNINQDTKDNYYLWMILIIIIKSYSNTNQIDKSLMYILISLKCSNQQWMKVESFYYLTQYYIKVNNNTKSDLYFRKCAESCNKIGDLKRIIELIRLKEFEKR